MSYEKTLGKTYGSISLKQGEHGYIVEEMMCSGGKKMHAFTTFTEMLAFVREFFGEEKSPHTMTASETIAAHIGNEGPERCGAQSYVHVCNLQEGHEPPHQSASMPNLKWFRWYSE